MRIVQTRLFEFATVSKFQESSLNEESPSQVSSQNLNSPQNKTVQIPQNNLSNEEQSQLKKENSNFNSSFSSDLFINFIGEKIRQVIKRRI